MPDCGSSLHSLRTHSGLLLPLLPQHLLTASGEFPLNGSVRIHQVLRPPWTEGPAETTTLRSRSGRGSRCFQAWVWPACSCGEGSGAPRHTAPSLSPGPQLTRRPGKPEEKPGHASPHVLCREAPWEPDCGRSGAPNRAQGLAITALRPASPYNNTTLVSDIP